MLSAQTVDSSAFVISVIARTRTLQNILMENFTDISYLRANVCAFSMINTDNQVTTGRIAQLAAFSEKRGVSLLRNSQGNQLIPVS